MGGTMSWSAGTDGFFRVPPCAAVTAVVSAADRLRRSTVLAPVMDAVQTTGHQWQRQQWIGTDHR